MFAGAAREAVFANPEVIRRVNAEFIPVSVGAALLHQPSRDPERQLLYAIGRSAPAPQGIAVLNSDAQVLDWTLMFDDDAAVLDFLRHTRERFDQFPDRSKPFETARYQRYPSHSRPAVSAHQTEAPAETAAHACPARAIYSPGSAVAKVVGRRLDEKGGLIPDTVDQEDYAQDQFVIPPNLQQELWNALSKAESKPVAVPSALSQLWATYAYLGMLDVRPINNPAGAPCARNEVEFHVEADPVHPNWHRVSGRSHVVTSQKSRRGDGAGFDHHVDLNWRGFIEFKEERISRLLLSAEGEERLRWGNGRPPGSLSRGPEVANLPGGKPIDWQGRVRYGISAAPARPDQISAEAAETVSAQDTQASIRGKMQRLQRLIQKRGEGGGSPGSLPEKLREFQRLMQDGQFLEAEEKINGLLREFGE